MLTFGESEWRVYENSFYNISLSLRLLQNSVSKVEITRDLNNKNKKITGIIFEK